MSANLSQAKSAVIYGEDAISAYLQRLHSEQLTVEEQRVGVSRKPKLGEVNHGQIFLASDEFPDENMPND